MYLLCSWRRTAQNLLAWIDARMFGVHKRSCFNVKMAVGSALKPAKCCILCPALLRAMEISRPHLHNGAMHDRLYPHPVWLILSPGSSELLCQLALSMPPLDAYTWLGSIKWRRSNMNSSAGHGEEDQSDDCGMCVQGCIYMVGRLINLPCCPVLHLGYSPDPVAH